MWWREYGGAPDPGGLPAYEYDAHMAILEGLTEKRQEEQREAEREQKKASRAN